MWRHLEKKCVFKGHICRSKSLNSIARYTPSQRSAVGQFLFVGRLSFLSAFCAVGWSWSLSAFFGRFYTLNRRRGSSAIWSFWLAVQLANQCARKTQNGRATWLSSVEHRLGVRATMDPDAARTRSLLSSPLVRRRRLGVWPRGPVVQNG